MSEVLFSGEVQDSARFAAVEPERIPAVMAEQNSVAPDNPGGHRSYCVALHEESDVHRIEGVEMQYERSFAQMQAGDDSVLDLAAGDVDRKVPFVAMQPCSAAAVVAVAASCMTVVEVVVGSSRDQPKPTPEVILLAGASTVEPVVEEWQNTALR